MIYIKNKITSKISALEAKSFLNLSKNIRDLSVEATQQEADSFILEETKSRQITQIKTDSKRLIDLPIKYNGSTFVNNQETILHLQSLYLFKSYAIDLHDIDDNIVNLTKTQAEELGLLLVNHRSLTLLQTSNKIKEVNKFNRKKTDKVNNINIDFS